MSCKVKICGITSYPDAAAALDAGADALGFVFAPSGREILPAEARRIVDKLPPFACCVGVFVDAPARTIQEIAQVCELDSVQLQGNESPDCCRVLGRSVIKGFKVGQDIDAEYVQRFPVSAYLFDAYVEGKAGGTGQSFRWSLLQGLSFDRPVVLAGGLDAENVEQAILAVRPYGVDVSSGVESAIGKKDRRKMYEFVKRAKRLELNALVPPLSLTMPSHAQGVVRT